MKIKELYAWVVVNKNGSEAISAVKDHSGSFIILVGIDLRSMRVYEKKMIPELKKIAPAGSQFKLFKFTTREEVELPQLIEEPPCPNNPPPSAA